MGDWRRVGKGGHHSQADNRTVDVEEVTSMLSKRSEAKIAKKFDVADKIAVTLQAQGICYVDEKREWYTRKPLTAEAAAQRVKSKAAGGAAAAAASPGKRKRDDDDEMEDEAAAETEAAPVATKRAKSKPRESKSKAKKRKTSLKAKKE
mmetsp:Transcript_38356/g.87431  ORF Transcript_38356/g.87431 Transcript_38356/m.87431 type:complete len:149 (-) Transcript_38356:153-599(-)